MINGLVPQGWQCPICGDIYSPITSMCYNCSNQGTTISTSVAGVSCGNVYGSTDRSVFLIKCGYTCPIVSDEN